MVVADALKATEALKRAVPLLAGSTQQKDYEDALLLVEYLLLNDPTSPLMEIITSKIKSYEDSLPAVAHFQKEMAEVPSALAILRTLIDQHGLTLSDFQHEIGSKSMVSRVLRGERQLTLTHIKKLAARFGVSPALFID
ncbi:helix-turn-helix domain-containing protein [Superficieibacter sp.]|uniref:helix-turn-helix domain-containing protein n=1 Tax=Superficieibacter sp. TaxID=2303322 RepID=UPI0028A7DAF6|nr:helix-turn-helix domain-containing protein [Superficieibacter sp.]